MATTVISLEPPKLSQLPIPTGGGRVGGALPRTFAAVTANSSNLRQGKAFAEDSTVKGRMGHHHLLDAHPSFASVGAKLRLSPRLKPIDLTARQYGLANGTPTVHFTTDEFDAGVALFRHSLIAKFSVGRPPLSQIQEIFKANWLIKGRATVSEIWDGRHVMIILDSEEDATVALTSSIRKVGHAKFRLFRYSPEYNPRKEASTTTKWVRLPGLHPGFFSRNYISGIVNVFGHFLDIDERTKACASLRYARVCVEVDVTKAIPKEVQLTLSDGRMFKQIIVVEGNLAFCSHCRVHGHFVDQCRKKKRSINHNVAGEESQSAWIDSLSTKLDELVPAASVDQSFMISEVSKAGSKVAEGGWVVVNRKKGVRASRLKNRVHLTNPVLVLSAQPENKTRVSGGLEEELAAVMDVVLEESAPFCSVAGKVRHKLGEGSPAPHSQQKDALGQDGDQVARGCLRLSGWDAMIDVSQSVDPVKVVKALTADPAIFKSIEGLKGRAERAVVKENYSCAKSCSMGPGKKQSQMDSSDSDDWSASDDSEEEIRSSIHCGKTIRPFQMRGRGELKKKEAFKSQMKLRKDKLEALKRTYIEELGRSRVSISSKMEHKALDEETRKVNQSFKCLKAPSGRQSALELFRGL